MTPDPSAPAVRTTTVRHGKAHLLVHHLREASPDGTDRRPLLHLHGLGERSPVGLPKHLAAWPGPVVALDFTGHGGSTVPVGGGYTAEILLGDVDAAICEIGPVTLFGRGLGAYISLLASGALAEQVRGAILFDGPGLVGGGIRPSSPSIPAVPAAHIGTVPDPLALAELSRDVRPPDYTSEFARQAVQWSGLDHPLAVVAVSRPEWLAAVADEPGVLTLSLEKALALYAGV